MLHVRVGASAKGAPGGMLPTTCRQTLGCETGQEATVAQQRGDSGTHSPQQPFVGFRAPDPHIRASHSREPTGAATGWGFPCRPSQAVSDT